MNMEDHRHEDYTPPPKPKVEAFSGAGHKLGRLEKLVFSLVSYIPIRVLSYWVKCHDFCASTTLLWITCISIYRVCNVA